MLIRCLICALVSAAIAGGSGLSAAERKTTRTADSATSKSAVTSSKPSSKSNTPNSEQYLYAARPYYYPTPIPSVYYNYYHPAAPDGHLPARLYLCPLPAPPLVGYTWISYIPFSPHEFLWVHNRTYYRVHPDGGTTVTTVDWEAHR